MDYHVGHPLIILLTRALPTALKWIHPFALGRRTRLTVQGKRGRLSVAVEVLPIVPGISMVEVMKVTGDSVDFYTFYAGLTQQVHSLSHPSHCRC